MRQKPRTFLNQILGVGLLSAAALLVGPAKAEPVLMSPPEPSAKPQSQLEAESTDDMSVFIPSGDQRDGSLSQPFKTGPFVFRPHLSYDYTYAHGLLVSPGSAVNTSINTVSLGLTVDLGRHWTLDYTPSVQIYSAKGLSDNVSHSLSLIGNVSYEDWVFGFSQTYNYSDATLVETASQTKQQVFGTTLSASHQLNDKFSTDISLDQLINDVSTGGQNTRSWTLQDWINYQVADRLFFGVGGTLNYVNVDISPDQLSEGLQARVRWRATDKISFAVRGGFEYREILDSAYKDQLNPLYGVDVQYAPFAHTHVTLSASRFVGASEFYLVSQSTENTLVSLSLDQRLLETFNFSTGINYTHTDYNLAFGSLSSVRTDDNYSFSVRLSHPIFKRGSLGVSYQYSKNISNVTGYSYLSNQVGVQASFAY